MKESFLNPFFEARVKMNKLVKKVLLLLFVGLNFMNLLFSEIIVYYGKGCPHCARTISILKENNIDFIAKEVYYNPKNQKELFNLYEKFSYPAKNGGVPTILVKNGNKSYLIIGELGREFYKEALNCSFCENGKVYSSQEIYERVKEIKESKDQNSDLASPIEKPNNNLKEKNKKANAEKLTLLSVIIAALIDSINPCVLAIMAMLLMNLVRQKTRKKAIIAGLIFSFTVTFIYFLMGLGVIKALTSIGIQKTIYYVLLILAIIFALLEFKAYFSYKPGFLSIEMPMALRPLAKKIIETTTSIWFVFITAVFLSFFLVPCSSGPYLLVLAMIASQNLMEKITGLIYLIIYNLIFSLPMLLITILVGFGVKPEKIQDWRNKNIKKLHLVAGILMSLIVLLLILQIIYY
jgi:cytochrome c biogenesis protein CcdA/glutaredoxin-related protein